MNHSHLIPEDKIPFALSFLIWLHYILLKVRKSLFTFFFFLEKTLFKKIKQEIKRGKLEPITKQFAVWESLPSSYELNESNYSSGRVPMIFLNIF